MADELSDTDVRLLAPVFLEFLLLFIFFENPNGLSQVCPKCPCLELL